MKKSFLKYQVKYWVPVYAYLLIIFYFSSQPIIPVSILIKEGLGLNTSLQHMLLYAGLALTIRRAMNYSNQKNSNFFVIFSTTLYGITDEIHQNFVPGRFFDLVDVLMDFLGSVLALFLVFIKEKVSNIFSPKAL